MIRKIEIGDINCVFLLLNELYNNEINKQIFTKKYNDFLSDNNSYGILLIKDDKVVGVLIGRIINRLVKNKNILFIDDLIVDNNYRGNGIGNSLLKEAITYAKDNDCETVELTSYLSNTSSHRLYEKVGFSKKHYKFKLYLDEFK